VGCLRLIIAHYKEDLSWLKDFDNNVFVVKKDFHLPNKGREPSSYLWYIINYYDELTGVYCFLQGKPLEHQPRLKEQLQTPFKGFYWLPAEGRTGLVCNNEGRPHDNGLDIKKFLEAAGISYDGEEFTFNGCAQFMITAEQLRSKPKSYYERLYELLMADDKAPYVFERVVGLLFS
jgi:hypothetical protein